MQNPTLLSYFRKFFFVKKVPQQATFYASQYWSAVTTEPINLRYWLLHNDADTIKPKVNSVFQATICSPNWLEQVPNYKRN
jgi:hypothetical protein